MPCRISCASALLEGLEDRAGVEGAGWVPVEAGVRCLGGIVYMCCVKAELVVMYEINTVVVVLVVMLIWGSFAS